MRLLSIILMSLLAAIVAIGSPVVINQPEVIYVGTNAVVRPLGPATVCGESIYADRGNSIGQLLVIKCALAEHFTWQSVTGQVYAVQSSTDLSTWTNTGVNIIGRGGLEEWYEPLTKRYLFHRLVLINP